MGGVNSVPKKIDFICTVKYITTVQIKEYREISYKILIITVPVFLIQTNMSVSTFDDENSLTGEEREDIYNAVRDFAETYIEENAIAMSKPGFHESFLQELSTFIKVEGKQEGWYNPSSNHNNTKQSSDASSTIMKELEIMHGDGVNFNEDSVESTTHISNCEYDDSVSDTDDYWKNIAEDVCTEIYDVYNIPPREILSNTNANIVETHNHEKAYQEVRETLDYLSKVPVQKQRSDKWFEFRHGRFSASNLWKLFSTQAQYNSLIYEKCKPLDSTQFVGANSFDNGVSLDTRSPMSWGIKYEPLTLMLYEYIYKTKVKSDYGCIPHINPDIHIGASPDAINIDPQNPSKYGTMVEVKNIVQREITGIPSQEYWIQMQTQMECCNLQQCDFVETRFKEYENRDAFVQDESNDEREFRGAVLFMLPFEQQNTSLKSMYLYSPVEYHTVENIDTWIKKQETVHEDNYVVYNVRYWYLDQFSCTLIKRNETWFSSTIETIQNAWTTVELERKEGFEHRAPKKRNTKKNTLDNTPSKCMIEIPTIVVHKSAAGEDISRNDTNHLVRDSNHMHSINVIPDNVSLVKLDA